MKLSHFLDQDLVFTGLKADDKSGLLALLADRVAERYPDVNPKELQRKLTEREEAGSTGIGFGVAVPHATVDGLPNTVCLLALTAKGIDFEAIDHRPVRMVFLLVSPPGETGLHIKLLARIARLIKSGEILKAASQSMGSKEIYDLIAREDARHVE